MSDDSSSIDWLPAGWSMDVKVQSNGRNYKCYSDPSRELKFYSKQEVLRHLNNNQVDSLRSEEKNKKRHIAVNFLVEKTVAEGLPPGWIKEMRVRKKGRRIRRDQRYVDPVSGYIFHSMKDVFCYLETGVLGRLASKPKEKVFDDAEMEDFKSSSLDEVEGIKSAYGGKGRQGIRPPSSRLGLSVKDEQILASNSAEGGFPPSDRWKEYTAKSIGNMPETDTVEQRAANDACFSSMSVSPSAAEEVLPEKQPTEVGEENRGRKRLKNKKWADLPRRASKRLANIKINSEPELNTDYGAGQTPAMLSADADAVLATNHLSSREVCVRNTETQNMQNEKQECSVPEDHAEQIQTESSKEEGDEKDGLTLPEGAHAKRVESDSDGRDEKTELQWMNVDPCIEFAIKTLTGAIPIGDENKSGEYHGRTDADFPDSTNPSSSLELWNDPCIEFAVQTLKGEIEIPVADDDLVGIQGFYQQHLISTTTPGRNAMALPNQLYGGAAAAAAAKPFHTQVALMSPMFLQAGNVDLQPSGSTNRYQHVEENGNRPRPTIIR